MLKLELRLGGSNLSRDEFCSNFKQLLRPLFDSGYHWAPTLYLMLMEMVKNIYDHGGKSGVVLVQVNESVATFEVRDFGEGYKGGSAVKDFDSIAEFHEDNGSSVVTQDNRGIGLSIIRGGLKHLREAVDIEYEIVMNPSFCYSGKITFETSSE